MANILLVDDDVESLWSLQVALEGGSHRVSVAGDVRRALDILRRNPIQCIVTDYEMPEIDGVEFCRIVRSLPDKCALPIVILSASPEPTHTPPFWNRFFRKPASFDELISVIEEHTGRLCPAGRVEGNGVPKTGLSLFRLDRCFQRFALPGVLSPTVIRGSVSMTRPEPGRSTGCGPCENQRPHIARSERT